MITFKQFLYEAEVSPMAPPEDIDGDLMEFINEHCSDAMIAFDSGSILYRGFQHKVPLSVLDPSTGTRKSENTSNWYTTFLDTNPANNDWPKRSKSFICSTSLTRAKSYSEYSDDTIAMLLPFDGVKIAEILAEDLWETNVVVDFEGEKLNLFYHNMNNFWAIMTESRDIPTYSEAKSIIEGISDEVLYARFVRERGWDNMKQDTPLRTRMALEAKFQDNPEVVRKMVLTVLEKMYTYKSVPDSFKLNDSAIGLQRQHECWFSGKCLVVPKSKWHLLV